LTQDLRREPTSPEIAADLDVPVSAVGEAMNAYGCYTPQSLDGAIDEAGETSLSSMLGGRDPAFGRAEAHAMLMSAVRRLSERDRRIIALRFYHDLTQREIAAEIGVTQMQVSRLLTRILLRLRDSLSR
jgi:RNA polymerase sigma-B factor